MLIEQRFLRKEYKTYFFVNIERILKTVLLNILIDSWFLWNRGEYRGILLTDMRSIKVNILKATIYRD